MDKKNLFQPFFNFFLIIGLMCGHDLLAGLSDNIRFESTLKNLSKTNAVELQWPTGSFSYS